MDAILPTPSEVMCTTSPPRIREHPFVEDIRRREECIYRKDNGLEIIDEFWATRGHPQKMYDDLRRRFGHTDWYNWQVANWGVKWDVSEPRIVIEEDELLAYAFDTPWGPPIEFFSNILDKYPKLTFVLEYEEPGMGFRGVATGTGGGEMEDDCEDFIPETYEDEDYYP